jgi:hypothetical protein
MRYHYIPTRMAKIKKINTIPSSSIVGWMINKSCYIHTIEVKNKNESTINTHNMDESQNNYAE